MPSHGALPTSAWFWQVQLLVAPHSISYFRPETVGYTLCQVLTSYNPDAKFIWSAREHSPDWRIPDAPEGGLGGSVDGWCVLRLFVGPG